MMRWQQSVGAAHSSWALAQKLVMLLAGSYLVDWVLPCITLYLTPVCILPIY